VPDICNLIIATPCFGGQIWAAPRSRLTHIGSQEFSGEFGARLFGQQ